MKMIEKYRSFRDRYIVQKRRPQEYIFNRYYAHLIDPFFTKLVYDLKLTPNIVTIMSGLIGVFSGLSFIFGNYIAGGILLQMHHLLDGADGNLARLTNRCTSFGARLDKYTDQVVRTFLLIGIIVAADAPLWVDTLLVVTFALDLIIVHYFVLPFIRRNGLVRAKWKQWFLDKGIIVGFDIFTIYFVISVFAIIQKVDVLIYILIIMKSIDWLYRSWECIKTSLMMKRNTSK